MINDPQKEQLKKIIEHLSDDIIEANIYFKLYKDLTNSLQNYETEWAQSKTFWHLVINGIRDYYLTRLCRIYDRHRDSLSLHKLLSHIENSFPLTKEERFILNENKVFLEKENPLVAKIIIWRDKFFAHKDAKEALSENSILLKNPVSSEEIEELLEKSKSILNHYSRQHFKTTHSTIMIGHDDYKSILKFLRLGLQKWRDDHQIP